MTFRVTVTCLLSNFFFFDLFSEEPLDKSSVAELAVMDVHSRHNKFNIRQPKLGPLALSTSSLSSKSRQKITKSGPDSSKKPDMSFANGERPIKTNAKVLKDEQYRKDMYLAFVRNAFSQKSMVNTLSCDYKISF